MAGIKKRGIVTKHHIKTHDDRQVIPCMFVGSNGGKGVMVAQYKDTRDLVLDEKQNPIMYNNC
jgi:hypothetical protein